MVVTAARSLRVLLPAKVRAYHVQTELQYYPDCGSETAMQVTLHPSGNATAKTLLFLLILFKVVPVIFVNAGTAGWRAVTSAGRETPRKI